MDQIGHRHLQGDEKMHNNMRLLLQLIKAKADISSLTEQGLAYTQISALFGEAIKQEWLKYNDSAFRLTNLGEMALLEDVNNKGIGHQSKWISADERYVIPQIGINDIFLPKKKDSYFS